MKIVVYLFLVVIGIFVLMCLDDLYWRNHSEDVGTGASGSDYTSQYYERKRAACDNPIWEKLWPFGDE